MIHTYQCMINIRACDHCQGEITFRSLCHGMDANVWLRNHRGHYNDLQTTHRNGHQQDHHSGRLNKAGLTSFDRAESSLLTRCSQHSLL